MRLQAIVFGIDTLMEQRELERDAFNLVFHEAGLPWRWDAGTYSRLCHKSDAGDALEAFIRTERPRWRNTEDLQHLLTAVRRRQAAICRDLAADPARADEDMIAIAGAARAVGLALCAVMPWGQRLPSPALDMAVARTHEGALTALNVPVKGCIAIECTTEGFDAAADVGIVTFDKLAISRSHGIAGETAIIALLEDIHARGTAAAPARRFISMALIA